MLLELAAWDWQLLTLGLATAFTLVFLVIAESTDFGLGLTVASVFPALNLFFSTPGLMVPTHLRIQPWNP